MSSLDVFFSYHYRKKTYKESSSSKGGAIESKDEVIKVNINIDGNIQTIELKNGD